jgi:hypothetical protein
MSASETTCFPLFCESMKKKGFILIVFVCYPDFFSLRRLGKKNVAPRKEWLWRFFIVGSDGFRMNKWLCIEWYLVLVYPKFYRLDRKKVSSELLILYSIFFYLVTAHSLLNQWFTCGCLLYGNGNSSDTVFPTGCDRIWMCTVSLSVLQISIWGVGS